MSALKRGSCKKKYTMTLRDPLTPKQAARIESTYQMVRTAAEEASVPLDAKKCEQQFVTELVRYIVGVDRDVIKLPFDPDELTPIVRPKLTKRQRQLVAEVLYVWLKRFPTEPDYIVRLVMLARFAYASYPVTVEKVTRAVYRELRKLGKTR